MVPSYNSTKVIHEARLRELSSDGFSQTAEQITDAGLWTRLRAWLVAGRERRELASRIECPSHDIGRTNVLTLK